MSEMKEHPEICFGCGEWVDVEDRHLIEHEVTRLPANAHERRAWKRTGRPKCSSSGQPINSPAPTVWLTS